MAAVILTGHKKKRGVFRASATRMMRSIQDELKDGTLAEEAIEISIKQLIAKGKELSAIDDLIEPLVLELDENNFEMEIEEAQTYREKMLGVQTRLEVRKESLKNEKKRNGGRNWRESAMSEPESTTTDLYAEANGGEHEEESNESENEENQAGNQNHENGERAGAERGNRQGRMTPAVRLPKLEIKKFNGNIAEWQNFWSLFESTIHRNPNLDKTDKFSYLKSYLEGEAARVIGGLSISRANYDTAIKTLTDRFGRNDIIINAHMNNLINLAPVRKTSDISALRKLHDSCEIEIRSLEALGIACDSFGTLLCPILIKLVPEEIAILFTRGIGPTKQWKVRDLLEFLSLEISSRERAFAASKPAVESEKRAPERFGHSRFSTDRGAKHFPTAAALNTVTSEKLCLFCDLTSHSTIECRKFSPGERRDMIQKKKRCFICLRVHHQARFCRARFRSCKHCSGRHHYTLCYKTQESANSGREDRFTKRESDNPPPAENETVALSTVAREGLRGTVYLKTAQVLVSGGGKKKYRCLFDGASHRSFINSELSKKLKLEVLGEETLEIFPFESESPIFSTRKKVKLELISVHNPEIKISIIALEIPEINAAIFAAPSQDIVKEMQRRGLKMADCPQVDSKNSTGSTIDIMIGADYFWEIVSCRTEMLGKALATMETRLGWVVHGRTAGRAASIGVNTVAVMNACIRVDPLSDQLREFWELESLGINDKHTDTLANNEVLEQFESKLEFKDGRYVVGFPWKQNKSELGENYAITIKRTKSLLSKLERDPILLNQYNQIIKDQLDQGIIEIVADENLREVGKPYYYLPHRSVISKTSSTTPLRIVYDASSNETGFRSLNECLEAGPNLSPEIIGILLRFREKRVAFTADIQKAFLQISLAEEERDSVRFLWINVNKPETPFRFCTYRMTRVPFGVTASPFLLAATVRYHVRQQEEEKPRVSQLINEQLYVEDLAGGGNTVEEAFTLSKDTSEILRKGSMHLRKWNSNSPELRELWIENGIQSEATTNEAAQKILGIVWNSGKDLIHYDLDPLLQSFNQRISTKRGLIQAVAKIYDPLGLLSPYTVRGKMMFQKLWEKGLSWDEKLPAEIEAEFDTWCEELIDLREVEIPRYYYGEANSEEITSRQIHCFVDASEKAYATNIYIRYEDSKGKIATCLIASKTKVAPLKKLTLPRLELMGAVLGARLVTHVINTLSIKHSSVHLWSDSTVTLQWIRGSASRWKPFIANRVREVQELTNPQMWQHCKGTTNPADLPSRGMKMSELVKSSLWWHGPDWLRQDYQTKIQSIEEKRFPPEALVEERKTSSSNAISVLASACEEAKETFLNLNRFSNLSRLNRTVAWIYRFVNNCRNPQDKKKDELTGEELSRAEEYLVKRAQRECFPEEMATLERNEKLQASSKILTLHPFLDPNGLLRVGGRLDQTNFSYEEKHPWLLLSKHRLSELIVGKTHERIMHAGLNETLVEVRERFWVVRARQLVKKIINQCCKCKRFRAQPSSAPMASLPGARVTPSPPFETCGLDYAGPLYTKSGEKCYIALFTCAVTRAVHLELVSDLTTEKFLLAFRRFISRRGIVRHIFSDNAKTFKRANEDLKILAKQ